MLRESSSSSEELGNNTITQANAIDKLAESQAYATEEKWDLFIELWKDIYEYQHSLDIPEANREDEFFKQYNAIQTDVSQKIIHQLSYCTSFDIFRQYLSVLSVLIHDSKKLWDIVHSHFPTSVKVTLRQSHEISAMFLSIPSLAINNFAI